MEQTDPGNLRPLYEVVDVEALERVIESVNGSFTVQFTYYDYAVTILGEDEISFCAIHEKGPPATKENREQTSDE